MADKNPYDQFDAQSNPYDQFDNASAPTLGQELKGAGEAALNVGTGVVGALGGGLNYLGTLALSRNPDAAKAVQQATEDALTYQPRSAVGQQYANDVNNALQYLGPKEGAYLGQKTADITHLPALGAAVNAGVNALPLLLGDEFIPRGARAIPDVLKQGKEVVTPKERPPSTQELQDAANQAYKVADESGVVISKDAVNKAVNRIQKTAAREGIDPTLHPDSMAALKRLQQAADNHLSLQGADILHKVLGAAKGAAKPADRRMASLLQDKWDSFVENLKQKDMLGGESPEAAQILPAARALYAMKSKSADVERLLERAKEKAAQYSQSGLENAIRGEFRRFVLNDKAMRKFTPEEQAALKKVARGTLPANALRFAGKFAPHGVVSTALGGGIGYTAAGPLGAAATLAGGELARLGATALTKRSALQAAETMRRGAIPLLKQGWLQDMLNGAEQAPEAPAGSATRFEFATPEQEFQPKPGPPNGLIGSGPPRLAAPLPRQVAGPQGRPMLPSPPQKLLPAPQAPIRMPPPEYPRLSAPEGFQERPVSIVRDEKGRMNLTGTVNGLPPVQSDRVRLYRPIGSQEPFVRDLAAAEQRRARTKAPGVAYMDVPKSKAPRFTRRKKK